MARSYTNAAKQAMRVRVELARFDEDTYYKVYFSLLRSGLDETQALNALTQMQDDGILFREAI
jgi:hypothetical protein